MTLCNARILVKQIHDVYIHRHGIAAKAEKVSLLNYETWQAMAAVAPKSIR